jgi:hypothetical protein
MQRHLLSLPIRIDSKRLQIFGEFFFVGTGLPYQLSLKGIGGAHQASWSADAFGDVRLVPRPNIHLMYGLFACFVVLPTHVLFANGVFGIAWRIIFEATSAA